MLGTTGGKNTPEDERIEPEKNDGLSLLQMFFNGFFLDSRGVVFSGEPAVFFSQVDNPKWRLRFFPQNQRSPI